MNFFIIAGILLLGAILGQAANYISDVLPLRRKFTPPFCQQCQNNLTVIEYLWMTNCPHCQNPPSIRRWIVLVLYPVLLVYLYIQPHERLGFWLSALIAAYLLLIGIIDIERKLILVPLTIAGVVIGTPIGYLLHGFIPTILGGVCGFLVMFLLYLLGIGFIIIVNKIRKKPTDEVALGFGDVSLSAVLGLILGFPGIFLGIFFAVILGGAFSILFLIYTLVKKQYQPLAAIPYAPFLIISTLILLFH